MFLSNKCNILESLRLLLYLGDLISFSVSGVIAKSLGFGLVERASVPMLTLWRQTRALDKKDYNFILCDLKL